MQFQEGFHPYWSNNGSGGGGISVGSVVDTIVTAAYPQVGPITILDDLMDIDVSVLAGGTPLFEGLSLMSADIASGLEIRFDNTYIPGVFDVIMEAEGDDLAITSVTDIADVMTCQLVDDHYEVSIIVPELADGHTLCIAPSMIG